MVSAVEVADVGTAPSRGRRRRRHIGDEPTNPQTEVSMATDRFERSLPAFKNCGDALSTTHTHGFKAVTRIPAFHFME